jgi:hypothetical protein
MKCRWVKLEGAKVRDCLWSAFAPFTVNGLGCTTPLTYLVGFSIRLFACCTSALAISSGMAVVPMDSIGVGLCVIVMVGWKVYLLWTKTTFQSFDGLQQKKSADFFAGVNPLFHPWNLLWLFPAIQSCCEQVFFFRRIYDLDNKWCPPDAFLFGSLQPDRERQDCVTIASHNTDVTGLTIAYSNLRLRLTDTTRVCRVFKCYLLYKLDLLFFHGLHGCDVVI